MDSLNRILGNYQLAEELGRGGMAVVYRAHQPSLNRDVAIKVLPPHLSFDQEFVERFQREARAAASLRHPNIVVIHDVGHEGGTYYIVMEYLEGRTLKELIQEEGPLPPDRTAHIIEQVATALDYAHERGFVHRDVKPANIFVGPDDHVTLTDFGIAKAASETQQLTRTGMLIGTPEYMSPEQAEGGRVDQRTDLYALGVVLYQMLAGRVPFRGTTPHATLHAVIYEPPPPPRQINPNLPIAMEEVIMKAVAKQPDQRFQRGGELTAALKAALEGKSQTVPVPPPPPAEVLPARRWSPVVWIVAAIAAVLVLIAVGLILLLGGGEETAGVGTTEVTTPQTETAVATNTAVPPSATAAVPTTAPATESIVPTEGPATYVPPSPTDSPISPTQTLAPPTDTSPPPTNTPPPPTNTPPPLSPTSEARYGRLAFSSNRDGNPEIYVMNLAGGSPTRLTRNAGNDWLPDWSPDGTKLAFTSNRTGGYDLWVMNGDGGGQTPWVTTGAWDEYARWAPDGQRLSLSTTATTQGVPNSEIFVRQSNGNLVQVTQSTAEDQWADWSPDGRIIYAEGFQDGSDWDIYIVNADGSYRNAWLQEGTCDVQPTWSPNGQWIAFLRIPRDTNGNGRIDFEDAGDVWVGRADGSGLRQVTSGLWASTPAWSPDGEWLAFARHLDSNGNGQSDVNDVVDIWAVPLSGGEAEPLVQTPYRDGNPTWTW
ncbi:MAG: protein kinase [Anaerolineae bacterium]